MRPRLLTALAAGALTLSLLGPVGAQADDPELVPGPSLPEQASETAREQATDALDEAQALFEEKSPAAARRMQAEEEHLDATMVLNQLMRVYDDLSPSQQRQADRLFARPTDDGGDEIDLGSEVVTFEYEDGEETPFCGEVICIHYARPGDTDAPDPTDEAPANGVPDAVDQALLTAEQVHATYVDAGYLPPKGDGSLGNEELPPGAPENLVDIYLADTGAARLYGYCTTDPGTTGRTRPAYCVIDNDFAEFSAHTPLENQQVTLAHEYYHAVQFAYDYKEDPWLMEATATWAEDELFTDVNDNRYYLNYGQLRHPRVPLDEAAGDLNVYGNWIFFRYLTERWDAETGTMPNLVLDIWKKASSGTPNRYSTQAIQAALAQRGRAFTPVYGQFADAIRRPKKTFDEGSASAYRAAAPRYPIGKTWRLSTSRRTTGPWTIEIDHLTSAPLRYKPDSGLRKRDWKLRLKVDMPPAKTAPVARVARYLKNGKVSSSTIPLKATGFSTKVVGFSSRNVKYVELVLVNASRRMRNCGDGWAYACEGYSRDDFKRTDFSASVFRR